MKWRRFSTITTLYINVLTTVCCMARAIPFNVHTPLWTSSIKFEPLRKKDQSADTNTPQKLRNFCLTRQKKRKDQRMPMHTTPQKRLFQHPSEILVHRGVCILNGMAPRIYTDQPVIYAQMINQLSIISLCLTPDYFTV
jgi:hypothetical protein